MGWLRDLMAMVALLTGLAAAGLALLFWAVRDGEQRRALVLLMASIALQMVAGGLAMMWGWSGRAWTAVNYAGIALQACGVAALARYCMARRRR